MRKYLILKNYFSRAFGIANKHLLSRTEALMLPTSELPLCNPPIFIIGPPRSGSTVIFQIITDAFDIGYLSNKHCRWFGAPALAERLFNPLAGRPRSSYRSSHGVIDGQYAPSECGAWWYRFFRRDPAYVTLGDVDERKMLAFRRSIVSMERASGLPLIFKNLYTSLRLEPMSRFLSEAIYIVVERDWVDNAQSILYGRMRATGQYDIWWSVPPPDVVELAKLPPVSQVVGQLASIHNLINHDIKRLGLEDRTYRISYEKFCADVRGTLTELETFLSGHGVNLKRRFEIPAQFEIDKSIKIPQAMYKELIAEVSERPDMQGQSQPGVQG